MSQEYQEIEINETMHLNITNMLRNCNGLINMTSIGNMKKLSSLFFYFKSIYYK